MGMQYKQVGCMNSSPFAEVIESSLTTWKAQSWKWSHVPPFGSLVIVHTADYKVFGIVYQMRMGSGEQGRTPFPYQKTEAELLQEHPQIFEFLQTTFDALTLGFEEDGKISYQLAQRPPNIHTFVRYATPEEYATFFSQEKYMHVLHNSAHLVPMDELLLALLKHRRKYNLLQEKALKNFIETYSLVTNNDYRRLKMFLQRIEYV